MTNSRIAYHSRTVFQFGAAVPAFLLLFFVCGCGSDSNEEAEVLDESWFTLEESAEDSSGDAAPVQTVAETETGPDAAASTTLEPGTSFPLHKVIEKTLLQQTAGTQRQRRERIELFYTVRVDDVRDQQTRFGVIFDRVTYESIAGNDLIRFDSRNPSIQVPEAAAVYAGMINYGFEFQANSAGQLVQVIDFESFHRRCLSRGSNGKAPGMDATTMSDQARYVKELIGLLPGDANLSASANNLQVGSQWMTSRHYNEPVPMVVNGTYSLRNLTSDQATVEVNGQVAPVGPPTQQGIMTIQVRGGRSSGSGQFDRLTGLPINSHLDHQIEMHVTSGSHQIDQTKRVVTTIRQVDQPTSRSGSFNYSAENIPAESSQSGAIQPAGHQQWSPQ